MTDAGLQFPCLALSLAVLLSLFAVPAYAAGAVWDAGTRDSVTINGYTVTGNGVDSFTQKVRSIHTWSPATGGVEFEHTLVYTAPSNAAYVGLGKNPFAHSDSNFEQHAIEYSILRSTSTGSFIVKENGVTRFTSSGTFASDTVFKIIMDSNGRVRYYANDALQYTSAVTASGDYYLHAVLRGRASITIQDSTPPVVTAPSDVTADATGTFTTVALGTATATDIFDSAPTITNDALGSFPIGVTTVTWTATDTAGNTATATQRVTVRDTTPPLRISAPPFLTVEATGPLTIIDIGTATVTNAGPNPTVTHDAPESFPIGTTVVTWTATDSGNTVRAYQVITVRDTLPPVLSIPADITAEATGQLTAVDIGTATATDADPNPTVTHDAPESFPLGTTTVTWTATDSGGRTTTATQTVTVRDTTPPVVTAPAGVTAEATGPLTTLDVGAATATDAVDPNPTVTHDAPGSFPPGETAVTWTATDSSDNKATATQIVTVQYTYSEGLWYNHTREAGNQTDTVTLQAHRGGDSFSLRCLFFGQNASVWHNQSTTYYEAEHSTTGTVHARCYEKSNAVPTFQVTSYAPYTPGSGFDTINEVFGSDGLFGVPLPFLFVLLVASMWTGRSAQVGIIVTAATIGIMTALGLFELQPEAWALIVLLTAAGVFLGKKLF